MSYRFDYGKFETVPFEALKLETLKFIFIESNSRKILFMTEKGEVYCLGYNGYGKCYVENIHGDLEDLIGFPILVAQEDSSKKPGLEEQTKRIKEDTESEKSGGFIYRERSETWTFYRISTIKDFVTIQWYGSSNGHYSESPTFERLIRP